MKKSLLCIVSSLAVLPTLSYAESPYFSLKDGDLKLCESSHPDDLSNL